MGAERQKCNTTEGSGPELSFAGPERVRHRRCGGGGQCARRVCGGGAVGRWCGGKFFGFSPFIGFFRNRARAGARALWGLFLSSSLPLSSLPFPLLPPLLLLLTSSSSSSSSSWAGQRDWQRVSYRRQAPQTATGHTSVEPPQHA